MVIIATVEERGVHCVLEALSLLLIQVLKVVTLVT